MAPGVWRGIPAGRGGVERELAPAPAGIAVDAVAGLAAAAGPECPGRNLRGQRGTSRGEECGLLDSAVSHTSVEGAGLGLQVTVFGRSHGYPFPRADASTPRRQGAQSECWPLCATRPSLLPPPGKQPRPNHRSLHPNDTGIHMRPPSWAPWLHGSLRVKHAGQHGRTFVLDSSLFVISRSEKVVVSGCFLGTHAASQ